MPVTMSVFSLVVQGSSRNRQDPCYLIHRCHFQIELYYYVQSDMIFLNLGIYNSSHILAEVSLQGFRIRYICYSSFCALVRHCLSYASQFSCSVSSMLYSIPIKMNVMYIWLAYERQEKITSKTSSSFET